MRLRPLLSLFILVSITALGLLPVHASEPEAVQKSVSTLFGEAIASHEKDDNAGAADLLRQALQLRPNNPRLLSALAQVESLAGQLDRASATLLQVARLDLFIDVEATENFAPLKSHPSYQDIAIALKANLEPQGHADIALQMTDKVPLIEAVAYDQENDHYYLSSIVKRKILRVLPDGTSQDFTPPGAHGMPSPLGIKIDAAKTTLWVAAVATDLAEKLGPEVSEPGNLYAFDLTSGALIRKIKMNDGKVHEFGDLVIADDGTVFMSDSKQPFIYRLRPDADTPTPFITHDTFKSLQGLALSQDQNTLFVADYAAGLYAVDLATEQVFPLAPAETVVPYGIDGLYTHGDGLIAIQNGTRPQRVVRFHIDLEAKSLISMAVLVANHPAHLEPTLGQVVGNKFYYVANSGWPLFGGEEKPAEEDLPATTILKLKLG